MSILARERWLSLLDDRLDQEGNGVADFAVAQGFAFLVHEGGCAGIRFCEFEFPTGAAVCSCRFAGGGFHARFFEKFAYFIVVEVVKHGRASIVSRNGDAKAMLARKGIDPRGITPFENELLADERGGLIGWRLRCFAVRTGGKRQESQCCWQRVEESVFHSRMIR